MRNKMTQKDSKKTQRNDPTAQYAPTCLLTVWGPPPPHPQPPWPTTQHLVQTTGRQQTHNASAHLPPASSLQRKAAAQAQMHPAADRLWSSLLPSTRPQRNLKRHPGAFSSPERLARALTQPPPNLLPGSELVWRSKGTDESCSAGTLLQRQAASNCCCDKLDSHGRQAVRRDGAISNCFLSSVRSCHCLFSMQLVCLCAFLVLERRFLQLCEHAT